MFYFKPIETLESEPLIGDKKPRKVFGRTCILGMSEGYHI